ncbi:primosomal replication protein [Vibrio marisflavi]|uniref:Primosomal replication protein N n=1 Tax=Vibrio marisflavi CECT 7928 TaxID=634439 RepID=A0ABN8E6L6_9VIBR|nr:primosomal replication protein [Vibrio marisflavi]CAH0540624.1 Primosomal replication protein N'' [Vibrio marisflavi CECT 7928]
MRQLSQIEHTLESLNKQATQVDRTRGEHHQALFDERLFHGKARLLVPCVEEAQATLSSLTREQQTEKLTRQHAEFLTQRLVAQIEAIQRELSTLSIRKKEPKHRHYFRKSIHRLYQDLAQHQEWERRLKEMVRAQELAVSQASFSQQAQAQQTLIKTEQRLKRCQDSKLKLEKQITFREKSK